MGNPTHMRIIKNFGVPDWNKWREENKRVQPDLTRIDLSGRNLEGIDLHGVGLFKANLSGANLRGAILRQSILIKTNFRGADLTGASVYGASVWDVDLTDAIQRDLVVTEPRHPTITVDNLEVAQFIHLMITNKKIRDIIDTITSKVVLILGRFTPDRKAILDQIRELARDNDLLLVLFDFDGARNRDVTETVQTLTHLARFVIADVTAQASIPHELQAIVPHLAVRIVPIIQRGNKPYSMFQDFRPKYYWMLNLLEYNDIEDIRRRVFREAVESANAKLFEMKRT